MINSELTEHFTKRPRAHVLQPGSAHHQDWEMV
jgi:hypothetical protein